MPYITDTVLSSAVAAAQTLGSAASLPAHFLAIIPAANLFAYSRIRNVLFDRGYTPAQVDAWDDRVSWNTTLGVCCAFWQASKSDADRGEAFRREYELLIKDLTLCRIVVGGLLVDPTGTMGRVGFGEFDAVETGGDLHTMDDVL